MVVELAWAELICRVNVNGGYCQVITGVDSKRTNLIRTWALGDVYKLNITYFLVCEQKKEEKEQEEQEKQTRKRRKKRGTEEG